MRTARLSRSARNLITVIGPLVWILLASSQGHAQPRRYAVVIGNNIGDADETPLLYAEDDARRIGNILRDHGGFAADDVIVLADADAETVRSVLIRVNARVRANSKQSFLFVLYSGHGNAESLHLRGSHLAISELNDLISGSPASARVLVIDACRSGALTRVKGGTPGASYAIKFDDRLGAEGVAMLTSSAAGEDSQESDQLKASFFTHYLASALLGAADRNHDGRVTLGEAFQYAASNTLRATATTVVGPQHPTYRYDLGGRSDLVLTRIDPASDRFGTLSFSRPGAYLVQRGGPSGSPVAEVTIESDRRSIVVRPGRYFITRREPDQILQGSFQVSARTDKAVDDASMRRIAYAQVVRKGGTSVRSAASAFATLGARSPVVGLGIAPRGQLGVRADFPQLSVEWSISAARSDSANQFLAAHTLELSAEVSAVRAFDIGRLTVSGGLSGAGTWFHQSFSDSPQTPTRDSFGAFVGPVAQLQIPISSRVHLRVSSGLYTYFIRSSTGAGDSTFHTPVVVRASAGLGLFL